MDSITFKNYRQFKDETTFELKNINIFVGKNNSGKSTLTKGIRLYLFNLQKLEEDSFNNPFVKMPFFKFGGNAYDNPHVGTFGRAFTKGSTDNFMSFSARFGHITIKTIITRYYKDINGNQIDCFDKTTAPISRISITDDNLSAHYVFDFENSIQKIEVSSRGSAFCYNLWAEELAEIKKDSKRYKKNNLGEGKYILAKDEDRAKVLERCLSYSNKNDIIIEEPLQLSLPNGKLYMNLLTGALKVALESHIKHKSQNGLKIEDYALLLEVIEKTSIAIAWNVLGCEIEYIEAHSVTHSVVYNISDKNDYMAQTILAYLNEDIRPNDSEKEFIEAWMMKFDIGEDFEIESIGGECYKLNIIEDVDHPENTISLLDIGVGSNQIMILLLQMATIMHKNRGASIPPMVIIEEPEQNLHPKLQSCLADLFREVYMYPKKENKNSKGISFIIETHSEYLVRKSQVLVAKRAQTEANPFTVFYMEKGKEPREIRYQDTGVFYDDFGDGFYDEAISLTEEIV